jgi:predicted ATPase
MIQNVHIENFKSIPDLTLDLGLLTVLIGANGSGKSNILEAIALASAAAQDKLDNEFLITRGIRVTETRFMQAAFKKPVPQRKAVKVLFAEGEVSAFDEIPDTERAIQISVSGVGGVNFKCRILAEETATYPKWKQLPPITTRDLLFGLEASHLAPETPLTERNFKEIVEEIVKRLSKQTSGSLPGFLIFAPENTSLRTFQVEGQILPLGIRGEGLFAHLKALDSSTNRSRLEIVKQRLALIDWFENFDFPENLGHGERSINIRDRYLPKDAFFDQRSANEGFLFLLFYITLFVSPDTPSFFAIDNIDTSLNPKLCVALIQQLALLSKQFGKQVILTTHNPAVLDGLDLHDDEQRLLVVDRNKSGHTRVRRVDPPKLNGRQPPVSLSEAFLRGYIGGLPKNF